MKTAYKLEHKRVIDDDFNVDEVYETKLLGFFSSEEKCRKAICNYLEQPGFKDYPEDFVIEKVEANIDDFNDIAGDFNSSIFYLAHEWYDGEYDHISHLGYYSSIEKATRAKLLYLLEPEYKKFPDGFSIDEYTINKCEWQDGFFTY